MSKLAVIALKVSVGSRFLWKEAAAAAGLTLSAWLRQVADAAAAAAGSATDTPKEG